MAMDFDNVELNSSTATTQSADDNSTKLATTAYVDGAINTLAPSLSHRGVLYADASGNITEDVSNFSYNDGVKLLSATNIFAGTSIWSAGNLEGTTATLGDLDFSGNTITNGTDGVNIGDAGTEGSGINVNGVIYDVGLRVNDIGGSSPAEFVIHRHSTTLQAAALGVRSNSNTSSHGAVTNGMALFSVIGGGWTGSHYDLFGSLDFSADSSGTISSTSSPGKIELKTTPDGANIPATALTIDSAKLITTASDISIGGNVTAGTWQGSTIGIAYGGTNNASYTSGSVIFYNGTSFTDDNSNFFWDDTNNRLGIGTATPNGKLHLSEAGATNTNPLIFENTSATSGKRNYRFNNYGLDNRLVLQSLDNSYGFVRNIASFYHDGNAVFNNITGGTWQGSTVAVGYGGTGSTSFTAGSVVFSNGTILTQDNSNFFWDDTNNRLGIGTAAPDELLHIEGSVLIDLYNNSSGGIYFRQGYTENTAGNDQNVSIKARGLSSPASPDGLEYNAFDGHVFTTNYIDRVAITTQGNVGIGTITPAVPLHLDGGTDASLSNGSGYFVIGQESGANIVFDNNEIIARSNGAATTLFINGGSSGSSTHISDTLYVDSSGLEVNEGNITIQKTGSLDVASMRVWASYDGTTSSNGDAVLQLGNKSSGTAPDNCWYIGLDGSTGADNFSPTLKIGYSGGWAVPGSNDLVEITDNGEVTMPSQPAFSATVNTEKTNVTGDGTIYSIIFEVERFDQGSDYNTTTGTFTAPVTGKYLLTASAACKGLNTSMTTAYMDITTSNGTYRMLMNPANSLYGGQYRTFYQSEVCDMDIGDTAVIKIYIGGSTKTVDMWGNTSYNWFTGALIC